MPKSRVQERDTMPPKHTRSFHSPFRPLHQRHLSKTITRSQIINNVRKRLLRPLILLRLEHRHLPGQNDLKVRRWMSLFNYEAANIESIVQSILAELFLHGPRPFTEAPEFGTEGESAVRFGRRAIRV